MRMVRKQVYITPEQDELLKRVAEERGVTEAEVIRAALDTLAPLTYEQGENTAGRIREAAVMDRYMANQTGTDAAGLVLDRKLADEIWAKEVAFLEALAAQDGSKTTGEAWKFNRDELYEERLAKILRRH